MKKLQYRWQIWKQIYPYFYGVKFNFVADMASELLLRIIAFFLPVLYGIFVERVILDKNIHFLTVVLSGYIVLGLMKSGISVFQIKCRNKVNNTVYKRVRVEALKKFFGLKYERYRHLDSGDVKMTIEDAVERLTSFQVQFYQYGFNICVIVGVSVILLSMNWKLALIAFISIPVTFFLDHMVSHNEKEVNEILNENDASWASWLDETINNWREIRVNQYGEKRRGEFKEFQGVDEKYFMTWLRFWVTRILVIPKIKDDFFLQFTMYFVGGILIYYKHLSIGVLLVFVQYYNILSENVKAVSSSDANLQSEMPHYERILKHLRDEADVWMDGECIPEDYSISFKNVSYKYPQAMQTTIDNLSFRVDSGTRFGICGESGVGKSTILKLLLGVIEPQNGVVEYGNRCMEDICKKKLYRRVAYISQEDSLFNMSIEDNLRLANESATEEELIDACKRACIYDYICALPDGFQTQVGEKGCRLSGGQRQRLLLAAALLRNPSVYILDEATSALDNQVEDTILETLKCIPRDKTVIVVAHKEHFMKMCDYVMRI